MNVQSNNQWFLAKSKVLTLNGYKNIERVTIDDHLLSTTGTFRKIMQLHQIMYTGKTFDIEILGHGTGHGTTSYIDTQSFYVREKKPRWDSVQNEYAQYKYDLPIWKMAEELTIYSHIGIVVNQDAIIPQFMVGIPNISEYWYIIGFLVGNNNYTLEKIRLTNGKYEHHILIMIPKTGVENEIIKRIQRLMSVFIVCCETASTKSIMCHDTIWYEILKTFGKPGKKQFIPEWVQQAPVKYIQDFMSGYKKICVIESYAIAIGLQRLYLKLGQILYIKSYIQPKHIFYMCEIISVSEIFIENGYAWFPIVNISKTDSMNVHVYNVEIKT